MARSADPSAPVFLVHGDDDYAVKQRARQLFQQWSEELGGRDHEIIDAQVSNTGDALKALGKLREGLQTLPFFGGGKVIWLQSCNFLGMDRTSQASAVTETVGEIAQELKEFQWQNVRLLISASEVDKRRAFYKTIEKLGTIESFLAWSLDDKDWAGQAEMATRKELRARKKDISEEALAELVQAVGPHRQQLANEIEKLCLYVGERPAITEADINAIVSRNKQARAFALAEALGDRTGQITVANGSLLNFESQPSFNLTVRGTDITGRTDDATITVNLSNVNEAPTDIALNGASVLEVSPGAIIGSVSVTDPDAGDTHAFTISDNRFEVVAGQLKLKAGISLDFETEPVVNLTITATDQAGAGLSLNEPFQITVLDVVESAFATIDEVQISSIEGNPGQDRKLVLTLRLGAALPADAVVHVATADGSAAAGTDYVAVDTDVTFLAGETVKSFEISIIEDLIDELDENLFVSLVGISANVVASDQVEAVILDDETQAIVLSQQQVTVPEGDTAIVTVGLLFESSFNVAVSLVKENGGDADLSADPSQFLFTPGNSTTTQNLTLAAASDADTAAGTAVFTLSAPNLASVQINAAEGDDETQVSLTLLDAAASEANVGQATNSGVFRLTRTGSTDSALTVDFTLTGVAENGVDYTALPLSAVIPVGATFVDVTVAPINDAVSEISETVILTILPSNSYGIAGADNATITIADNDPVIVTIAVLDAVLTEGTPATDTGTIRISRTGATTSLLNVNITKGGVATFGSTPALGDYNLAGGINAAGTVVMIPAGASFVDVTATPRDDTLPEPTETLTLTLAAGVGYALPAVVAQRTVSLNVQDNEPQLRLEMLDAAAAESGSPASNTATYRIHRTGSTNLPLTVNFTVATAPTPVATRGTDYVLQKNGTTFTTNTVIIDAGQAFVDVVLVPTDDALAEVTENVTINLAAGTTYTLDPDAADRTGTATIVDNEPVISIAAIDNVATESGNPATDTATFRITRTGGTTTGNLTVNFTVGTTPTPAATRTTDYTLRVNNVAFTTNSVVIPDGAAFVDVTVVPVDDALVEVTENVTINLATSTAYTLDPDAADRTAQATLVDNEPLVTIAAIDNAAAESGTPASNTATFRITRSGGTTTGNLTVNFTRSGNAIFGTTSTADYTLSGNGVTAAGTFAVIPDGASFVDVTLTPIENTTPELTETATLTLAALTSYKLDPVIANRSASATIADNEVRTIAVNDVTVTEGNGPGVVNATFTVTLSSASSDTVTIDVATSNGTANAGADYTALPLTTLTFTPGQTSKTVTVQVSGDVIDEENETFFLDLTNATNATIADAQGRGTITDNDLAPTLRINDVTVTETDGNNVDAVFTVTLSAASERVITFKAATGAAAGVANTLATAGADFTALALTTFTINPGQTSLPVTVTTLPDDVAEFSEKFAVNLSAAVNATIADAQGLGTITDDDAPTINIADAQIAEPVAGTANMAFNVTLSGPAAVPVTVKFTAPAGTAPGTAGALDITPVTTGTLTFNPGETSKNINIVVKSDLIDEDDETVAVTLSAPNLGTIADGTATGVITDTDATPTLSVNDVTLAEGDTGVKNFVFTVKLSAASGRTVSVDVATADNTATGGIAGANGADYTSLATTNLVFTPGQTTKTVNIPVAGDLTPENAESFFVNLANAVNATIADAQGIGTITSDEFALATIAGLTMNGLITGGTSGGIGDTFQITFNNDGTFTTLDNEGPGGGTFTYTKTGKNTARLNITNEDGPGVATLTFTSITTATYVLTQAGITELGTLTAV